MLQSENMSKTTYLSESRKNPPDHTVAQIATTISEGQQKSPLLSLSVAQIVTKTPEEQQKSPLPSHSVAQNVTTNSERKQKSPLPNHTVAQAVTKVFRLKTINVNNNIPR